MRKAFATALVLAGLVTPALAANYWVVQDTTTKTCSVVQQDQRPAGSTVKVVGTAYQSEAAAQSAMTGTMLACGGTE